VVRFCRAASDGPRQVSFGMFGMGAKRVAPGGDRTTLPHRIDPRTRAPCTCGMLCRIDRIERRFGR